MLKKLLSIIIGAGLGLTAFLPPIHAANLNDPYLPAIKYLGATFDVSARTHSAGYTEYPLTVTLELVVRVHANSLAGVNVKIRALKNQFLKNQCQFVSGDQYQGSSTPLRAGTTSGGISTPTLPVLKQLMTSKPDGEWRLEFYKFTFPVGNNISLPPCITDFEITNIYFIDEALHEKSILFDYSPQPIYEYFTNNYPANVLAQLPEQACMDAKNDIFAGSKWACAEVAGLENPIVGFTQAKIDAALVAMKSVTAKPSPSPAVSSTPTIKPSTAPNLGGVQKKLQIIRCQNKKVIKKIQGFNPVCPKGFTKI